MGSVAPAVLEFDEAVQAPWRPPLACVAGVPEGRSTSTGSPAVSRARPHAVRAGRLPRPGPAHQSASHRDPRGTAPESPRSASGEACPHCGRVGRCEHPPLRLTRRARRLLAALVLAGGVGTGAWFGAVVGGDEDGLRLVSDSSVVVEPGDTLWSIAGSVAGDADVRAVVDAIQQLNGLEGAHLVPGQVLRLP